MYGTPDRDVAVGHSGGGSLGSSPRGVEPARPRDPEVSPANSDLEHLKLRGRIGAVDRWGEALTIALVAYGIILALFAAYEVYDEVIRKLEELIRLL